MKQINLTVNGEPCSAQVEPRQHLADFLRENLLLTGTHLGCEHGVCGACTLLINGEPARSCITYAVACDGAEVRTIEGWARTYLLRPAVKPQDVTSVMVLLAPRTRDSLRGAQG